MKIGVAGATGRVGQLIIEELLSGAWHGLELAGATARDPSKITGDQDIIKDQDELFANSDAVTDFTLPDATMHHVAKAVGSNTPIIIGTTGLDEAQEQVLKDAAQQIPIVYAANMSVGVNLLLALVEKAAASLGPDNWDIEIFESHHKHKIDAPSGTALAIGKAAAKGRNVDLNDVADRARDGVTGERETGSIGFSVARGGDVVGEHTAYFYAAGERIELTHRATNRALFARGALQAAKWINGKPAGLYSMHDVLGL